MSKFAFNLKQLRPAINGLTSAFEELCCQLFRRAPDAPPGGRFRRILGAGGDGGVEAIWEVPNGAIWGLQTKLFWKLGASEKAQMKKSLDEAVANYPSLTRYTFCVPKALTGKKGTKSGHVKTGDHEKLASWFGEWRTALKRKRRTVEIDVWDESELQHRLGDADTSGGLHRYWFDQTVFNNQWFSQHLSGAQAAAGPRYSPELSVETPLSNALEAFGRSETWVKEVSQLARELNKAVEWWESTVNAGPQARHTLPASQIGPGRRILAGAQEVAERFEEVPDQPAILADAKFRAAVRAARESAAALEPEVRAHLIQTHGEYADSPAFRQWSAEMQADFPMASLDHLRDLVAALNKIEGLVTRAEGELPAATAMVIAGPAGIGKTHGIVDVAMRRNAQDLRSIVLFGEDFSVDDPWTTVSKRLGLGAGIGHDELLDALNAAGEDTGFPLVIFIDALNETMPDRRRWQAWLPPMVEQVSRRRFLKLAVSCRDTFASQVLPTKPVFPTVLHNGFAGQEYEAVLKFFEHYGLGAPAEPLLQDEFANPLFLHLVCDALRKTNIKAIPIGRQGFRSILDVLLQAKNATSAITCDYDARDNRVQKAVLALAQAMANRGARLLPYDDAKGIVDAISPAGQFSKSLFNHLEIEALISVVGGTSEIDQPTRAVRFAFERMGDYFIAEALLSTATDIQAAVKTDGILHPLLSDTAAARRNFGVLEALANLIPAAHGLELADLASGIDRDVVLEIMVRGLQWRDPTTIGRAAIGLILEALDSISLPVIEALFDLAVRPEHPLNADYLDRLLRRAPMLVRDPWWANLLELSFSNWTKTPLRTGAARIINTALQSNLGNVPEDVARLWCVLLAWFCASPDRRIRDRATKGMVKLFRAQPSVIVPLLEKFARFEDEYIAERVVVASYGALLLNPSADDLRATANYLYEIYFKSDAGPPLNSSLRDHARLIVEIATDHGQQPSGMDVKRLRPPYASSWPLVLPSVDDVKVFADDSKRYPELNLGQQFGYAMGTDFGRYKIESRVNDFGFKEAGLDKLGVFRWFLQQAVDLGYPGSGDQCAVFDRATIGTFGGGRGKPGWAERLGKKYYWVFLRRLIGQVADHVPHKTWSGDPSPMSNLQAIDLRDIDPTDIRLFEGKPSDTSEWFVSVPYVFKGPDEPQGDAAWVGADDLADIAASLIAIDAQGVRWHVLTLSTSWRGKRLQKKSETYRHVGRSVVTLTVPAKRRIEIERLLKQTKDPSFVHNGPQDYRGYLGEYPDTLAYRQRLEQNDIGFEVEHEGVLFEATSIRQLKGNEWEYDYSSESQAPSITFPSPALIAHGTLRWDGRGGWIDMQSVVQIMDARWWNDAGAGLLVREDYLDSFLSKSERVLVAYGYQQKHIAGNFSGSGGLQREDTIVIRAAGKVRTIRRGVEKPKASKVRASKAATPRTARTPRKSTPKGTANKGRKR